MTARRSDATLVDLLEQLDFLESSMLAYDLGREHEAKRMAVTLRVLAYDHGGTSVLSQLNLKDKMQWVRLGFIPTAADAPMESLTHVEMRPNGHVAWKPFAGEFLNGLPQRWGDFDTWWNAPAIRTTEGLEFSRRNLVLLLANRAGGAHLGRLDSDERTIVSGSESAWTFPVELNVVPPSVRTIAEEMAIAVRAYLSTLDAVG